MSASLDRRPRPPFGPVSGSSTIYADEAACREVLHTRIAAKRVNHSVNFKGVDARTSTNQAKSCFSRLRRTEIVTHHHISDRYHHAYAKGMGWCEDNRRKPIGTRYLLVTGSAPAYTASREWKGYWQRSD